MRPKLDHDLDYFIPAALAGLCYILFFHELGGIGFLGPDEPRYAGVAREMYLSGDYITPRLLGQNWFEKPVLMYWGAALGYAIFGIGETGARLPSAVGATLSVFLIYWAGRRLFARGIGMSAAVILATSIGFFGLARAASTDMLLTAALTAALAFFLVGHETSGNSPALVLLCLLRSGGLGCACKGAGCNHSARVCARYVSDLAGSDRRVEEVASGRNLCYWFGSRAMVFGRDRGEWNGIH